jgi:hypothetical protein
VQTQNAITETLSQNSIAQLAEIQNLKARQVAEDARTNAARYGAEGINALASVGAANFSRNMTAYNAAQDAERMAMMKEEFAQRMALKKEGDAEVQDTLDNINAYEKAFGRPLTTKFMLKKYYGTQGELGNYMRDADMGGFKLRQNGGSLAGVLGATPADSYFNAKTQNLSLPDAFKPSGEILQQSYSAFENARSEALKNPMGVDPATGLSKKDFEKPEQAKAAFNKIVAGVSTTYQTRIQPGKGNPYEALPISSVLQSPTLGAQSLARSKFGQSVLSTLQTGGFEQPTPEMMFQSSLAAVNNGTITLDEARNGITAFYTEAVGLNNATGGFLALNVPGMTTYNVKADDIVGGPTAKLSTGVISGAAQSLSTAINPFAAGGYFSSTKLVPQMSFDLTKSTDVTTALTMMQSKKMRDQILSKQGALTQ